MSNSDTPKPNSIEASAEEIELLEKLRANPVMAEKFGQIMERFNQEIASGGDAHQAELMVIEELRTLGQTMLGQWAKQTQDQTLSEAKAEDPALINHREKNSNGTAPSEI